jgi:hypothetical protein
MISRSDLAFAFRRVADEIEKGGPTPQPTEFPPPAPVPDPVPVPPPPPDPVPAPPPPSPSPPPPPVAVVPAQPVPVIDLDTIKGIQQAFNSIRAPGYAKLDEDGVDDKVFAWALKEFQATAGIPVTGKPDVPTINALHQALFRAPKP